VLLLRRSLNSPRQCRKLPKRKPMLTMDQLGRLGRRACCGGDRRDQVNYSSPAPQDRDPEPAMGGCRSRQRRGASSRFQNRPEGSGAEPEGARDPAGALPRTTSPYVLPATAGKGHFANVDIPGTGCGRPPAYPMISATTSPAMSSRKATRSMSPAGGC
jgi:hypothetical protein